MIIKGVDCITKFEVSRDCMVATFAMSVNHYKNCEFEFSSWRCVLDTTVYDKVCK